MLDRKLLDDCRRLAFDIAPELKENPLYVSEASLFEGLPILQGNCLGWAYRYAFSDLNYRSRLMETGHWEGPGPVIESALAPGPLTHGPKAAGRH